jgi:glycosyltransferase involved in cell wall biosynthesis
MRPSILHVITTIDRGGAENHLLELARAQVKKGHKVTVAYLKGAAEQKENFRSAGVEVIQGGKSFFAQFAKIHKLARSGLYPIVHAHLPQAELACLGIPNHIISRHNTEPFVPGVPKFLSSFIARTCTYRSTIIAISTAVKDYAKENAMITSHIPISVVYYGINHQDFQLHDFDREKWRQQEFNCEPEDFVFGTISRLVPQKDLQTLINAFSKISKEIMCKLVMVGDGVQRNELEKLVKSLNLESKVHFLGKRQDIPEFLNGIDAFTLTSKYEGLGLVLLEALASEVPIIAARNSAIKEIVNDDVALMFETSSVIQLETAMRELINNPAETKQRVSSGKIRVQQNFGVDSMLMGTDKVYSQVLGKN